MRVRKLKVRAAGLPMVPWNSTPRPGSVDEVGIGLQMPIVRMAGFDGEKLGWWLLDLIELR
jgi:hypothetical protein